MPNQSNFNITALPKPNSSLRPQLIAYANFPATVQNNAKVGVQTNFIDVFPIAAGASNHTIVFDTYTFHSSPEYPTIYPTDSQLVNGDLIAGGGSVGSTVQLENDFWTSYAPTVTNAWNQQFSPVNFSHNILSFAIWSDQPGTIQIFDPNSSAPLPINDAQSLAFPAGTSSNFMTTITDYFVPIPQFFVQINNTGTSTMGLNYFTFYLMSYPTFIAGFRG
ncbi:MAG: hypothetical protein ACYC97_02165 [Metallibacterium sp.]